MRVNVGDKVYVPRECMLKKDCVIAKIENNFNRR